MPITTSTTTWKTPASAAAGRRHAGTTSSGTGATSSSTSAASAAACTQPGCASATRCAQAGPHSTMPASVAPPDHQPAPTTRSFSHPADRYRYDSTTAATRSGQPLVTVPTARSRTVNAARVTISAVRAWVGVP